MSKRTKAKVKPPLYPAIPTGPGEMPRGARDQRITVGTRVRRPAKFSDKLGVEVPSRYGVVTRMYRRVQDGRVVLDTANGHSFYADEVVWSKAGEKEDAQQAKLLKIHAERGGRLK